MSTDHGTATLFEAHRDHLRAVAFRLLGSVDEADDVLQQAWLRAEGTGLDGVVNPGGWLTTLTSRICLDALRTRRRRGEVALTDDDVTGPSGARPADPAADAELADAVGQAMLVVLDRLAPAERVAFVLHDMFAVPFDEIAPVVGRTPMTAKKLASRARARVRAPHHPRRPAATAQVRAVVEAFRSASAGGDVEALLRLLAPDVVRRVDPGLVGREPEVRGAGAVAEETRRFGGGARAAVVALVDGRPGLVIAATGRLRTVIRLTVDDGLVTAYDVITDPGLLAKVDIRVLPSPDATS